MNSSIPDVLDVDNLVLAPIEHAQTPATVLFVDPGKSCGYAYAYWRPEAFDKPTDAVVFDQAGTWDLGFKAVEGGGMRFLRLRNLLRQIRPRNDDGSPIPGRLLVGFEDVRSMHKGTDAARMYHGIVAVTIAYCEESPKAPYLGVPVSTIKRRATGCGNASKEAMIEAAVNVFGADLDKKKVGKGDDDIADALWGLTILLEEHVHGLFRQCS